MENNEVNLTDFENQLILKNQLITLSTGTLCELYSNMDIYPTFVDSVAHMINEESAFLYISDDFIEKIHSVLQLHRFDIKDKERSSIINDIISCINEISNASTDMRQMMISGYIAYQTDIRDVEFDETEDFLCSLTSDAVVFLNLRKDVDAAVSDDLTLASINYFLKMVPEFFRDSTVKSNAEKALDTIYKRSNILDFATRIISNRTKKKIKEIKIEE